MRKKNSHIGNDRAAALEALADRCVKSGSFAPWNLLEKCNPLFFRTNRDRTENNQEKKQQKWKKLVLKFSVDKRKKQSGTRGKARSRANGRRPTQEDLPSSSSSSSSSSIILKNSNR